MFNSDSDVISGVNICVCKYSCVSNVKFCRSDACCNIPSHHIRCNISSPRGVQHSPPGPKIAKPAAKQRRVGREEAVQTDIW